MFGVQCQPTIQVVEFLPHIKFPIHSCTQTYTYSLFTESESNLSRHLRDTRATAPARSPTPDPGATAQLESPLRGGRSQMEGGRSKLGRRRATALNVDYRCARWMEEDEGRARFPRWMEEDHGLKQILPTVDLWTRIDSKPMVRILKLLWGIILNRVRGRSPPLSLAERRRTTTMDSARSRTIHGQVVVFPTMLMISTNSTHGLPNDVNDTGRWSSQRCHQHRTHHVTDRVS